MKTLSVYITTLLLGVHWAAWTRDWTPLKALLRPFKARLRLVWGSFKALFLYVARCSLGCVDEVLDVSMSVAMPRYVKVLLWLFYDH